MVTCGVCGDDRAVTQAPDEDGIVIGFCKPCAVDYDVPFDADECEDGDCPSCNGSGGGLDAALRCGRCNGSGERY